MAARAFSLEEKARYLDELRAKADEHPVFRALLEAHLRGPVADAEDEAAFAEADAGDAVDLRPRATHAQVEAMVDSRRRLEDDLEFRAELERRADAGNGLARRILDAPREPRALSREQEAALAEARARPALHAGTLSNEEILAVLEARWRAEAP